MSGYCSANFPRTKKVALMLYSFNRSSISVVYTGCGPSSKVKATTFSFLGPWLIIFTSLFANV